MKLVFATHNQNKFLEVKALMPEGIELLSLQDIDCYEEIAETAETLEGNARIKAQFIKSKYQLNCFADDTGLEVDALNGAPGVYSARYAGPKRDAAANMNKLLTALENESNRLARFKTVIALELESESHVFTAACEGQISRSASGSEGFGYDPIFIPEGHTISFGEMTFEQKNALSHRAKAIDLLQVFLKHYMAK